jgi:hypothetical protein
MSTPEKVTSSLESRDVQWHGRKNSQVAPPALNLPARPSMVAAPASDQVEPEIVVEQPAEDTELVAVFNANSPDGSSIVRALARGGANVIAVVRVFTSKNTKSLLQIPNVTVKVAENLDEEAIMKSLKGVNRAFLCIQHWERFESRIEEEQAQLVLKACVANNVHSLVFSTFEDTKQLRLRGLKSQIVPDSQGRIHPKFKQMKAIKREARKNGVALTHMMTSYLDQEISKKSLCLLVGENGKLIVEPHMMDSE